MTAPAHLALMPRDGIFCKDGRGWHTSSSGRGYGLDWPWPSTVLGALRTASGRAEEARTGRRFEPRDWTNHTAEITLGRTLVLRREPEATWNVAHRMWPAPADARRLENTDHLHWLEPVPPSLPTLGRDDDDAREALWVPLLPDKAKPLPVPRWWSEAWLASWLAGDTIPDQDATKAFDPSRRVQAHVQILEDTLTAKEEALYSHDVVETLERGAEWALGVEVGLPERSTPAIASLGSDSRLARIEPLQPALFEPPATVLNAFQNGCPGLRIMIVTSACFAGGWLPDGIARHDREYRGRLAGLDAELILRAAMVPRPVHISGWDMAAGRPKQASAMVPPGAVYFFERADGRSFGQTEARALWLAALGDRTAEGFGRVVPGIWNPKRS
jgi:CRISPR-associated protein Cmr3